MNSESVGWATCAIKLAGDLMAAEGKAEHLQAEARRWKARALAAERMTAKRHNFEAWKRRFLEDIERDD